MDIIHGIGMRETVRKRRRKNRKKRIRGTQDGHEKGKKERKSNTGIKR
jgi:hypothetical protein